MNDFTVPWQELYRRAMLELDPDKLLPYIESAEIAIHAERQRLSTMAHHQAVERQALEDALHALNALRRSAGNNNQRPPTGRSRA